MDEEQVNLCDFKMWSSTALKTLNFLSIIMTSKTENIGILNMVMLSLLLIFELIQQAAMVNFMLFLLYFDKCLVGSFYRKIE